MKRIGVVLLFLNLCCTVAFSQEWSISTNLAGYAGLGTMNIEAGYAPHQHWSVGAQARYNPFTFQSRQGTFQAKQRSVALIARWWPWHSWSGWWVATKLQYQEYNVGGIISRRTEEGDKVGVGLVAGYTYMVHPHINIEFGAGGWTGEKWYTAYSCPSCGVKEDSGHKAFVLPDDLIVSICYVF